MRFINHDEKYYLCTVVSGAFVYENEIVKMGDSFIVTSKAIDLEISGKGKLLIVESYK